METRSPAPEGWSGYRAGARDDAVQRPYARPDDPDQAAAARLRLLACTPESHGFMAGFAKANVSGLIIDRITVFAKDERKWCQLPAEPIRDAQGQYLHDSTGKKRYVSRLTLIEDRHGPIAGRR